MNANFTKPSGKGRGLLVAGSACKLDLPGSLPYAALSVLISCDPVATSETNQTSESSLFLIRKAQDNHLTLWLLSELQAASTEKKNIPDKKVAYTLYSWPFDSLCLKFLLKFFNCISIWFKNVLEDSFTFVPKE